MRLAISRASHCLPSRSAACSWLQAYTSVSYGVITCFLPSILRLSQVVLRTPAKWLGSHPEKPRPFRGSGVSLPTSVLAKIVVHRGIALQTPDDALFVPLL